MIRPGQPGSLWIWDADSEDPEDFMATIDMAVVDGTGGGRKLIRSSLIRHPCHRCLESDTHDAAMNRQPSEVILMLTTVEAVLQPGGALRFLEPVHLDTPQRVLVTFTQPLDELQCGAMLSELSLSVDWQRDEEDAAWAHLQADK